MTSTKHHTFHSRYIIWYIQFILVNIVHYFVAIVLNVLHFRQHCENFFWIQMKTTAHCTESGQGSSSLCPTAGDRTGLQLVLPATVHLMYRPLVVDVCHRCHFVSFTVLQLSGFSVLEVWSFNIPSYTSPMLTLKLSTRDIIAVILP